MREKIARILSLSIVFCVLLFTPVGVYADETLISSVEQTQTTAGTQTVVSGWKLNNIGWWWQDADGTYPINSWRLINNSWYYFDGSGYMATGWQYINGSWYYLSGSGAMLTGWQYINGSWYYLSGSGAMLTGWQYINGTWYYLTGSGAMAANTYIGSYWVNGSGAYVPSAGSTSLSGMWIHDNYGWWYRNSDWTYPVSTWLKLNGVWYYFDANGYMLADQWALINGYWYNFDPSGAMRTGWFQRDGKWYYLESDGTMAVGWEMVDGYWYYLDTLDGHMLTGWFQDNDGTWYDLGTSGALATAGMDSRAQGFSSPTGYLILVSRSEHIVGVYAGSRGNWRKINGCRCSVGAPTSPTITGTYSMGAKIRFFGSSEYRCWYASQISGDYLLHSIKFYTDSEPSRVEDGRLGMDISGGCVRLPLDKAKWIYDYIPSGTTINIY